MTSTESSSLLWYSFDASSSTEPSIETVGGKGLSLIRCRQAGFDVPEGFVLSVSFFEPWLQQIQATREYQQAFGGDELTAAPPSRQVYDAVKARCEFLKLSVEQEQALDEALASTFSNNNNGSNNKPTTHVAVRSSAPQEDSSQASLAGIYHTTLGVRLNDNNKQDIVGALIDSFASVLDYRVAAVSKQQQPDLRLAVVVQRQLDSDASGVAFSLDPHSNCYDEAVISANRGLGETVVAGVVTPDTYKVDKITETILSKQISDDKTTAYVLNKETGSGVTEEKIDDPLLPALTDEQILQVASLVTKVEVHMGVPIDIEWAFQESRLYLLQARPITTYLKLFPEMVTPPGEQKHLYLDIIVGTQGFSEPMSVLGMDVWGRMFRVAKPHLKPGPDGMIWELHGREFIIMSNMLAVTGGEGMVKKLASVQGGDVQRCIDMIDLTEYTPQKPTEKNQYLLFGVLKRLIESMPSLIRGLWDNEKAVSGYLDFWQGVFERFGPGGPEELREDITFAQAVDDAMNVVQEMLFHVGGIFMYLYSKWRIHQMFDGDSETQKMLAALNMDLNGNPTSEMGHAMLQLANFPEIKETETGDEFLQKRSEKLFSDEFKAAFDDYIAKFGCRGIKEIDIATPRSYEDIAHLFARIKQIDVENNQILTVEKRKKEAYDTLLAKATQRGVESTFKYHACKIQNYGGYREHPKYVIVFVVASLRRRALKLAEKFVKQGRLDSVSSIFDLTIDEITKAETDPEFDLSACIKRNKAPYKEVENVKDWPHVIDSRGKIIRAPRKDVEDGIGGDPISPGVVTGRARVLSSPYEKPLARGEILVTKATEPSWTPIFLNASGVVLEVGGPLQHGAIIAREYGIPCVSGVEHGTTLIQDGQMIEVDGTNGVVKILEENGDERKDEI